MGKVHGQKGGKKRLTSAPPPTNESAVFIVEEVLYLDKNGNVAGGGVYRVEIIAQLFGLSVRRIQQLTQEGVLHTTATKDGRRYELVPTIQAYVQYLSEKAHGKGHSEIENQLKEQKIKAEIALKESQGELHQLKTALTKGEYLRLEDVLSDYEHFFVVLKKFVSAIPARVGGTLTGYIDPVVQRRIEKDLQTEMTAMLRTFVVAGRASDKA